MQNVCFCDSMVVFDVYAENCFDLFHYVMKKRTHISCRVFSPSPSPQAGRTLALQLVTFPSRLLRLLFVICFFRVRDDWSVCVCHRSSRRTTALERWLLSLTQSGTRSHSSVRHLPIPSPRFGASLAMPSVKRRQS